MTTETANTDVRPDDASGQPNLERQIASLASECSSPQAFFSQALRGIAAHFDSPFAAICVQSASDIIEDHWHRGPSDPAFWSRAVQELLTSTIGSGQPKARLLSAPNSSLQMGLIGVPLLDSQGAATGGISLIARMTEEQVRSRVSLLESVGALMMHLSAGVGRAAGTGTTAPHAAASSRALLRFANCESPEELAFLITNSIRNNLGCQEVALGLVLGRKVKLLAISGQEDVWERSPGAIAIRQAMEECVDFGQPILVQRPTGTGDPLNAAGPIYRLHRQWHRSVDHAPVASIPLKRGGKWVAVLSLQHKVDTELPRNVLRQVSDTVEPFAAAMELLRRANRSLLRHAREHLVDGWHKLVGPGHYARKAAVGLTAALGCWLFLGTLEYRVTVNGIIQPAVQRHVCMPYDATLASAEKTAGDVVEAGEVLCRLDSSEMELQRTERRAELGVAQQEIQRCMAANSPAEARLAELQARLIRAQLAVIEKRIQNATVCSPIDGVVVAGDLRTRAGSVISQGTPLYQVAPSDGWVVELLVPDAVALDIRPGLAGRYACHARPEEVRTFRLKRVHPSTLIKDKQTVLMAEANFTAPADWLRPGMEGVAKIVVGQRPAWWVLFHSITDYLRMTLWL